MTEFLSHHGSEDIQKLECHDACKARGDDPYIQQKMTRYSKGPEAIEISEWKHLCNFLSRSTLSKELGICLISDVSDVSTAQIITKHLLTLPVLRDCAIRLSHTQDNAGLQALAQSSVQEGCSPPIASNRASFRLMDLPPDIQFRILEYTDLVTPYDVAWALDDRHHGRSSELRSFDTMMYLLSDENGMQISFTRERE
jgi:hypothetical protein